MIAIQNIWLTQLSSCGPKLPPRHNTMAARHIHHELQRLPIPLPHRRRRPPTPIRPLSIQNRHLHPLQPIRAYQGMCSLPNPKKQQRKDEMIFGGASSRKKLTTSPPPRRNTKSSRMPTAEPSASISSASTAPRSIPCTSPTAPLRCYPPRPSIQHPLLDPPRRAKRRGIWRAIISRTSR